MPNIRNFFIAFAVSLVVFLIAGITIMRSIDFPSSIVDDPVNVENENKGSVETSGDDEGKGESEGEGEEEEIEGNSFTAVFACTDTYTGQLDSIMLLRVNKEKKEYFLSSLPSYMVLSIDGIEYYLGDLVKDKGKEFFVDKVYAVTGMKVDYYAFVTLDGFVNIIDKLGKVTFTVPEDMYFEDHEGEVIVDLKKGTQQLDGEKALQLMRYMGYEDGDVTRRKVQKEFLLTALDTFLKVENIGKSSDMFFTIKESLDTNFTVEAFIENLSLIFKFKSFEKTEVEYPGVFNKSGDVVKFLPKIEDAIYAYKPYR